MIQDERRISKYILYDAWRTQSTQAYIYDSGQTRNTKLMYDSGRN